MQNGKVIFHGGSFSNLNEVKGKGTTFVVGCNTLLKLPEKEDIDFGTGRKISYAEALDITATFERSLRKKDATYRHVLLNLQNDKTLPQTKIEEEKTKKILQTI